MQTPLQPVGFRAARPVLLPDSQRRDNVVFRINRMLRKGLYAPDIEAALLAKAQAGARLDWLATDYHVSPNRVTTLVQQAGVQRDDARRAKPFSPEKVEKIVNLRQAGKSIVDIAAIFRVHPKRIKAALGTACVELLPKPKRRLTIQEQAAIVELRGAKTPIATIAKTLRVRGSTIQMFLTRHAPHLAKRRRRTHQELGL